MKNWWDKNNLEPNYYAIYKVLNTEVIVAGRPDYHGLNKDFCKSIDGWISVTDRFLTYPVGRHFWFPWIESGPPKPEVLYGVLKTLNYWIDDLGLARIYLHCDAGTHRSPTVFGAYLDIYHDDIAKSVADTVKLVNKTPETHSCALLYWQSYVRDYPKLKTLCLAIKDAQDDINWGYESLERILERVK